MFIGIFVVIFFLWVLFFLICKLILVCCNDIKKCNRDMIEIKLWFFKVLFWINVEVLECIYDDFIINE